MRKTATTTVPVHPLLAERWSPRGFDQAHETGDEPLTALLEAARWAPSAQNSQPWRFLVARRGEEAHDRLFAALAPGNQAWAGAASALVLVAARTAGETAGRSRGRCTTPARRSPRWSPRRRPTGWPCTRWAASTPARCGPGSASTRRSPRSSCWRSAARTAPPGSPAAGRPRGRPADPAPGQRPAAARPAARPATSGISTRRQPGKSARPTAPAGPLATLPHPIHARISEPAARARTRRPASPRASSNARSTARAAWLKRSPIGRGNGAGTSASISPSIDI